MEMTELQRNWDLFGKTDPLWSILNDPRRQNGRWNEKEFFQSGQRDIEAVFDTLNGLGVMPRRGRALDFGCGVGRLTQALCERFDSVVGVDIAPSMIELARRYNRFPERCEYAVNDRADLSMFPAGSFDFVFTLIVLQHMRPQYSRQYLTEFLRVTSQQGLIVFQVPSGLKLEPHRKLPPAAFQARIAPVDPVTTMQAGRRQALVFTLTNTSPEEWPFFPPSQPMALNLGNHWLDTQGVMCTRDDARTPVPRAIARDEKVQLELLVTPPTLPGTYILEADLVQEGVTWFGSRGSPTARLSIEVRPGETETNETLPAADQAPAPRMEMYCLPRREVERLISREGGKLLAAVEHHACGPEYENYQYFVQKRRTPSLVWRLARPLARLARSLYDHSKRAAPIGAPRQKAADNNGS